MGLAERQQQAGPGSAVEGDGRLGGGAGEHGGQRSEIKGVADDRRNPQGLLTGGREVGDPAGHQVDDIVGHAALPDGRQVPQPSAGVGGEADQPVLGEREEELADEERVAGRPFVDEGAERRGFLPGGAQRVGHEIHDDLERERAEIEPVDPGGIERIQRLGEGPVGVDFIGAGRRR